jgi:hypothetical protein
MNNNAAASTSTTASYPFPTEITILLLEHAPDLPTLDSAIRSCRIFYECYASQRETIRQAVAMNDLGPALCFARMVGMAYVFGADADVDVGEDESKKGDDGDRAGERSDAKELSEALRSPQRYFARKRGAIGREERKRLLYYLTVARRLEVHFSIMYVHHSRVGTSS